MWKKMLSLEVAADCVLKPLWVQLLLLGFFFLFIGSFYFAFFQEEGDSLHFRVEGTSAQSGVCWVIGVGWFKIVIGEQLLYVNFCSGWCSYYLWKILYYTRKKNLTALQEMSCNKIDTVIYKRSMLNRKAFWLFTALYSFQPVNSQSAKPGQEELQ